MFIKGKDLKALYVLFDKDDYEWLKKTAREEGMTLATWVRRHFLLMKKGEKND